MILTTLFLLLFRQRADIVNGMVSRLSASGR